MNIFGIGQNTDVDQIAVIQGRKNFATETFNSGAKELKNNSTTATS